MSQKTLVEIANDVATEIRIPAISSVFGNSNSNVVAVFDAIKKAAERDVFRPVTWEALIEEFATSGTGDSSLVVYKKLPADWHSLINDTAYDLVRNCPAIGGLTPYQWNALIYNKNVSVATPICYKLCRYDFGTDEDGGDPIDWSRAIAVAPVSASETFSFVCAYKSKNYVISGELEEPQSELLSDEDTFVFDTELVTLAATIRMLRSLGRQYSDQQSEFNALIKEVGAKTGGATRLNMSGEVLGDPLNIPGYAPSFAGAFWWRR